MGREAREASSGLSASQKDIHPLQFEKRKRYILNRVLGQVISRVHSLITSPLNVGNQALVVHL